MRKQLTEAELKLWNDDVLRDIDGVCCHAVIEAGLAAAGTGGCA